MGFFEIFFIGIGLSMDAVAVSMTNGMVYPKQKTLLMPLFFGGFQGLMPLLGFYIGGIFADFIAKYANIAIFLILIVIGGKMLKEGFTHENDEAAAPKTLQLTLAILGFQAFATSIDAFAVGIGFSALQVDILPAIALIAIVTFFCSLLAIAMGKKFGDFLGNKAEILGGIILCAIAIKALL